MHPTRRTLAALAVSLVAMMAFSPARAIEPVPYTQEAFDAAQKGGKPIFVDTYATWCDICNRQKPIIEKLLHETKFKDLVTFRVNFDTQKDVMRKLKAQLQSTLIVFRGTRELGRSVGETQEEWIEDLLAKGTEGASS